MGAKDIHFRETAWSQVQEGVKGSGGAEKPERHGEADDWLVRTHCKARWVGGDLHAHPQLQPLKARDGHGCALPEHH